MDYWPKELHVVFAAIGVAIKGRRLRPEIVRRLPGERGTILPGHTVRLRHTPRATLGGRSGVYELEITGDRWRAAGWRLWPGELERVSRAAALLTPSAECGQTSSEDPEAQTCRR